MDSAYIVVIDDDTEFLKIIRHMLMREGHRVQTQTNGLDGLALVGREMPHLLILDIMMPEMDGIEVCQTLRRDERYNQLPILFLSARGHTDDVVKGLDAGGDDYVVKPVAARELAARVRVLLRRNAPPETKSTNESVQVDHLHLDNSTYQIKTPHKTARLTATEYRLLHYFMSNPGLVLSPGMLLESVWAYPSDTGDPDLVRAHVRKLRAKMELDPNNPVYIKTIHGVGYTLDGLGLPE